MRQAPRESGIDVVTARARLRISVSTNLSSKGLGLTGAWAEFVAFCYFADWKVNKPLNKNPPHLNHLNTTDPPPSLHKALNTNSPGSTISSADPPHTPPPPQLPFFVPPAASCVAIACRKHPCCSDPPHLPPQGGQKNLHPGQKQPPPKCCLFLCRGGVLFERKFSLWLNYYQRGGYFPWMKRWIRPR